MLEIKNLRVKFHTRQREAVAGLSLSIQNGEIVGLVGESGSGKSVTAMSVAGLLPRRQCDCSGEILLDGIELLHADRKKLRRIQGRDIGVVFQEPMTSMDPLMKIGPQVEETLRIHTTLSRDARRHKALEALKAVELPEPEIIYEKYPHELSGGMCQRVMIAAAITSRPKLLLLDEPTTALDVTIQAQILELLKKLNRESGISMLFISHNLAVVRKLCSRVAVMQRGVLIEAGDVEQIFYHPEQEYTKRLIAAIPVRKQAGLASENLEESEELEKLKELEKTDPDKSESPDSQDSSNSQECTENSKEESEEEQEKKSEEKQEEKKQKDSKNNKE